MSRAIASAAVASLALLFGGCGASTETGSTRDARSTPKHREGLERTTIDGIAIEGDPTAAERRVLDAFGFVPEGFVYPTKAAFEAEDDPRDMPPGTAAMFLHKDDCCDPGDRFRYPPTVMLRKYPDVGTLDQATEFQVDLATQNPTLREGSTKVTRLREAGIEWTSTVMLFDIPGLDYPQHSRMLIARHKGMTYQLIWLVALIDSVEVNRDLERMWREVDWERLPAVDF